MQVYVTKRMFLYVYQHHSGVDSGRQSTYQGVVHPELRSCSHAKVLPIAL